MLKKIFGGIAILAIAVVARNVNVNSRTNGMSNVMLANVEALAEETDFINKFEKSVTTSQDVYEVINGNMMLCHITQVDCLGTGITSCTPYYLKNCF